MTKATPVPHSPRPTEQDGAPPAEHELFPASLSADDEDADPAARASDNGGGTSGNHGNGTAG